MALNFSPLKECHTPNGTIRYATVIDPNMARAGVQQVFVLSLDLFRVLGHVNPTKSSSGFLRRRREPQHYCRSNGIAHRVINIETAFEISMSSKAKVDTVGDIKFAVITALKELQSAAQRMEA